MLSDSLSHNADVVYAFTKQIKLGSDTTLADGRPVRYLRYTCFLITSCKNRSDTFALPAVQATCRKINGESKVDTLTRYQID